MVNEEESLTEPATVKSVERALRLLSYISTLSEPIGVNQLSREVRMHKATVSRLLGTLLAYGFVAKEPVTERYTLGLAFIQASTASLARVGFLESTRSVLQGLAESTGETATLAVRDGDWSLTLDQVTPDRLIVNMNWIGMRTPLHCTSDGKVFLAWSDEADLDEYLSRTLLSPTERSVSQPDELRKELEVIRIRGYAIANEELEVGLTGVAAPVIGKDGMVIASISISGPSSRVTPERVEACGELVKGACDDLQVVLKSYGHSEPTVKQLAGVYATQGGNVPRSIRFGHL
ncbi:MAG: IclR family transcriptional regulator [Acidimicrobiaceae bacterium]|nr:IclR family transcriptional regulator [Acidimicrobiaceae bacterium]